ncbi:cancer/testis antigen 2 [Numida meleagris]|uniref:cancer/testis antigen 2 n=1 Tax=Numida meleagris TaxID=8996 RepID=UPI000B3DDB70|nr:cancer/testis antigen 2 [Numida meleagris]
MFAVRAAGRATAAAGGAASRSGRGATPPAPRRRAAGPGAGGGLGPLSVAGGRGLANPGGRGGIPAGVCGCGASCPALPPSARQKASEREGQLQLSGDQETQIPRSPYCSYKMSRDAAGFATVSMNM